MEMNLIGADSSSAVPYHADNYSPREERAPDAMLINLATRILAPELSLAARSESLQLLIHLATNSQRLDLLLRIYLLAAAGEWDESSEELQMLLDAIPGNSMSIFPLNALLIDIRKKLKIVEYPESTRSALRESIPITV